MKFVKQLKRVGLVKKKQVSILKFNINKWKSLSQLLDKGYPLIASLEMIDPDNSKYKTELEKGKSIEEVLIMNGKDKFYEHLQFFLQITSLSLAIQNAVSMSEFEKNLKTKLWKQTSYPIFIFIFAFLTLTVFAHFIIPQMISGFGVSNNASSFLFILEGIKWFASLLIILVLMIIIYSFICLNKIELQHQTILFLSKYISVFQDFIAYLLSGYLLELRKSGLSTKVCFLYLVKTKETSLLNYVSSSIKTQLESGLDLNYIIDHHPLLSRSFKSIYRIGSASNELDKACIDFMILQEQQWVIQIKHIALFIQCIAYTFVAILVVVVYRIMLLPLELLNEM
ncbi:MAG: type II secretion system F family protein [Erysipelotrichaceae bacterium]